MTQHGVHALLADARAFDGGLGALAEAQMRKTPDFLGKRVSRVSFMAAGLCRRKHIDAAMQRTAAPLQ